MSKKRTRASAEIRQGAGAKRTASAPNGAGRKRTYSPPTHTANERVCWHFGAMDLDGPYGWGNLTKEHLLTVIEVVKGMETQTVKEVFDKAGYRQTVGATKGIPFANICSNAQGRLKEIGLDDTDLLYEIRITRRARVWCLRFNEVACLLWWDPDHKVCPRRNK